MKIPFSHFYYNSDDNNIYDRSTQQVVMSYDNRALIDNNITLRIDKVRYYYEYIYDYFMWGDENTSYVPLKQIKAWMQDIGPLTQSHYKMSALHILMTEYNMKKCLYHHMTHYELPPIKRKNVK